jgi:hypothetical protein
MSLHGANKENKQEVADDLSCDASFFSKSFEELPSIKQIRQLAADLLNSKATHNRYRAYRCYKCKRHGHIADQCQQVCKKCGYIHQGNVCYAYLVNKLISIAVNLRASFNKEYDKITKALNNLDDGKFESLAIANSFKLELPKTYEQQVKYELRASGYENKKACFYSLDQFNEIFKTVYPDMGHLEFASACKVYIHGLYDNLEIARYKDICGKSKMDVNFKDPYLINNIIVDQKEGNLTFDYTITNYEKHPYIDMSGYPYIEPIKYYEFKAPKTDSKKKKRLAYWNKILKLHENQLILNEQFQEIKLLNRKTENAAANLKRIEKIKIQLESLSNRRDQLYDDIKNANKYRVDIMKKVNNEKNKRIDNICKPIVANTVRMLRKYNDESVVSTFKQNCSQIMEKAKKDRKEWEKQVPEYIKTKQGLIKNKERKRDPEFRKNEYEHLMATSVKALNRLVGRELPEDMARYGVRMSKQDPEQFKIWFERVKANTAKMSSTTSQGSWEEPKNTYVDELNGYI